MFEILLNQSSINTGLLGTLVERIRQAEARHVLRGSRAGRRFGCRNHPSCVRACVREEDEGGREAGSHSTTPTYTVRRDGPAREPLVGVLAAETIHPACMCEGGGL